MLPSGDLLSSSIDFFDNVFTFFNATVTVNCCHLNDRLELATCGLGASCAGSCSALGAKLCPSGDCAGDCEMPFDQDTNQIQARGQSGATKPSQEFRWCSARCNVWKNKGCCYNPKCRSKRSKANHQLFIVVYHSLLDIEVGRLCRKTLRKKNLRKASTCQAP